MEDLGPFLTVTEVTGLINDLKVRYEKLIEQKTTGKYDLSNRLAANNLAGYYAATEVLHELQHVISKANFIKGDKLRKEKEMAN